MKNQRKDDSQMCGGLTIYDLTCNYLKNPVGLDTKPRIAERLGKEKDAEDYAILAQKVRKAFRSRFYDKENGKPDPTAER